MTGGFELPIFPPGSLDSSVVTTVWVGVLVTAFFNLRLGWTFSGLVVPGYLVPLIIARPWSAVVVVIEGLVTYLIVRAVSDLGARLRWWAAFFGRDRFFLILLVSVAVRLGLDAWALPHLGAWLVESLGVAFDYRSNLHSFGLIVVALIANQLWKPGLIRGSKHLLVVLATTWAVVRFGLMAWTNFNIGGLDYMYEDLASSIVASPKSYVILLLTAFLASRFNVRFGWEFNGILIPALLALQWYRPTKILTSFVEAFLVLLLAELALRSPLFHHRNVEGARKTLLFFNLSFAYKYFLAFALLALAPEVKITDFFGLGYLLPSLIALKMHDKGLALSMPRTILQTSLLATAMAVGLGLLIAMAPGAWSASSPAAVVGDETPIEVRVAEVGELLQGLRSELYSSGSAGPSTAGWRLEIFRRGVESLLAYSERGAEPDLEMGRRLLSRAGFRVVRSTSGHLLLTGDGGPEAGGGVFVIALGAGRRLTLEVPRPAQEWATLPVAGVLFQRFGARALAVADRRGEAAGRPATFFNMFHRAVGEADVVQVRGLTGSRPGAPAGAPGRMEATGRGSRVRDDGAESSVLFVERGLPASLDLPRLERSVGSLEVVWDRGPGENVQRRSRWSGFAELYLTRRDRRRILAGASYGDPAEPSFHQPRIDGYLQEWLAENKERIAPRGSDAYLPPSLEDLLFLDVEVLTPAVHLVRHEYHAGRLTAEGQALWSLAAVAAKEVGYALAWYRHEASGQDFLILEEVGEPPRFWGTVVLRMGEAQPYVVQIPRPLFERDTFEFGSTLFERLGAGALVIAGANPDANFDGSADVVQASNLGTVFNLAHQVILREWGEDARWVIQARALREEVAVELGLDALLATDDAALDEDDLDAPGRRMLQRLRDDGFRVELVDGGPLTAGYDVGLLAQGRYLEQTSGSRLAVLWLAPRIRRSFRLADASGKVAEARGASFEALGVPWHQGDLIQWVATAPFTDEPRLQVDELALLRAVTLRRDIVALQELRRRRPTWRLNRWFDRNTQQEFLVASDARDALAFVANLSAPRRGEPVLLREADRVPGAVGELFFSRPTLLEVRR